MDGTSRFGIFLHHHQRQLESSAVPKQYWESVYKKLHNQIFDAGLVFQLALVDYGDDDRGPKDPVWKLFVNAEKGLSIDDSNNIFLIDHAWTYDAASARQNLLEVPGLLDRMCMLMGSQNSEDLSEEEKVEFVLQEMWRYNQTFALSNGTIEERMPVWYIMDEVGCAINHSAKPNFRTVPFLYLNDGVTYTLLFPVKNVKHEEQVTRDFVEGQTDDVDKRRVLSLPWTDDYLADSNFEQFEPSEDYFLAGHIRETLPSLSELERSERPIDAKLKVYSEYRFVNEYLTHPKFEIVEDIEQADILWLMSHFKDYEDLSLRSPHSYVNQFPFENVLTIKDLLAIICRRKATGKKYDPETLDTFPSWLPTTYNLSTEICQFVAYFKERERLGLDNHWICKPWNLARGLDTHITKNLNHILRLPSTGPKIAQKYIESPVLYTRPEIGRVKFDIRYVVLLKSVKPLVAYAYSNFFLRFANKEFALNHLDVYEQHFTVMNYSESAQLSHVKCHDFIVQWNKMYPDFDWSRNVQPKILKVLRQVLEAASQTEPPKGIAHNPQSRAVYAADLMLEWKNGQIQPVILEVNFSPDNKRACEYYSEFYNDIFKCLFLDEADPRVFHPLLSE
ncbi:tubulin--tyrosine ligase-like protein 12 [Venturia canescens]|uniref:tubulin--tyrosine ligase-like protein 12 n=1 Tax=Venturia canescens TaxID=32260 RepID=UPI001C9CE073|nr:tubulin--tyrosine ligase-like protein 12 [Venturia canescens]